jgi:DNA-directed RNA polymerase subunit M/transcription elongation factor TFIIS
MSKRNIYFEIFGEKRSRIISNFCLEFAKDYYRNKRFNLEKKKMDISLNIMRIERLIEIEKLINPDSFLYNEEFKNKIKNSNVGDLKKIIKSKFLDENFWMKYKKNEDEEDKIKKYFEIKANTNIKCGKCGGGVNVNVSQTRSSDEGMTSFFRCIVCNFSWKV